MNLKIMIGQVGEMNAGTTRRLDEIYDRQKEVIIGKRNTNCLSCAKEPPQKHGYGNDGRIYRGMHG